MLHGAEAAASAEATARQVFEQGGVGGDLEVALLPADTATDGLTVIQALVQSGIVASGKEAKRLIAEGGLRLDNMAVADPQATIDLVALTDGIKISVGKKKHRMLRLDTASA
jgi:tyrosyl-tRNA synthetase